jgi:hypothetical protein
MVARTEIVSHASAGVIPRFGERGLVDFLVMDYTIRQKTSIRNVMGGKEGDETPVKTLLRELSQELKDKDAPPLEVEFYDDSIIHCDMVPDQEVSTGYHLKVFFLLKSVRGKFRDVIMIDKSKVPEEIHGVPRYVEARELIDTMRADSETKRVHLNAILLGLTSLAVRFPAVASRYSHYLGADPEPFHPLAIEYLKR